MPPLEKADKLFVIQTRNTLLSSNSKIVPIRGIQDAIDYIIHYNPPIVEVGSSMTDIEVAKLEMAVCPWFSGTIFKKKE